MKNLELCFYITTEGPPESAGTSHNGDGEVGWAWREARAASAAWRRIHVLRPVSAPNHFLLSRPTPCCAKGQLSTTCSSLPLASGGLQISRCLQYSLRPQCSLKICFINCSPRVQAGIRALKSCWAFRVGADPLGKGSENGREG